MGLNIVKSLNIALVWVPSFSGDAGMGSINSSSLNYSKGIIFFFNLDRRFVSAVILSTLGVCLIPLFL